MSQNCYFDNILSSAKIRWKTDSMCVLSVWCFIFQRPFSNWREYVFLGDFWTKRTGANMFFTNFNFFKPCGDVWNTYYSRICSIISKTTEKTSIFPEFSSNLEFLCSLAIHNFSLKSRVNEFSRTSLFYKSCRDF